MALINLSYCSSALGESVQLVYNDVTHVVESANVGLACSPGVPWVTEIYRHIDGNFLYLVLVDNTWPLYSSVVQVALCTVSIASATPTNASTNQAADGQIAVSATGNGTLEYSLDGINWQPGSTFFNLAPGTYTVRVRNNYLGNICFVQTNVTVGFTSLVCDLQLGTITKTAAPGATLTIVNYLTVFSHPVEYRLDAGAWQDSNIFTGLAAATYNVQIRFKSPYTACVANQNVVVDGTPCTAFIQGVVALPETARFANDGVISVSASSANGPIQYSKNNGSTYQAGNVFSNLAPGTYQVRIKDAVNCEAVVSVVVLAYKPNYVRFPLANALRAVITEGPQVDTTVQNFENKLLRQMGWSGITQNDCYTKKATTEDIDTLQWRSTYNAHTVSLYNAVNNTLIGSLTPVKQTTYRKKSDSRTASFCEGATADEVQVFFDPALPEFYGTGQQFTISGQALLNGTYVIKDIRMGTGLALGYEVLVFDKVVAITGVITGTLAVTYNAREYEVWEVAANWGTIGIGTYYLVIDGTDVQFTHFKARTEPIEVAATHDDHVKVEYWNQDESFELDYATRLRHKLRLEGLLLPLPRHGGERTVHEDSERKLLKLREVVTRIAEFEVGPLPFYLIETLRLALAHDNLYVDGIRYTANDDLEVRDTVDQFADCLMKLRQYAYLAENGVDTAGVDITVMDVDNELLELEP
jgi:hypothetical protein